MKLNADELAQMLHDRISEIQGQTDKKERKYLKWNDLKHPGFNGRYNDYMSGFIKAVRELICESSEEESFVELSLGDHASQSKLYPRFCYCCNTPFKPQSANQLACDSCLQV